MSIPKLLFGITTLAVIASIANAAMAIPAGYQFSTDNAGLSDPQVAPLFADQSVSGSCRAASRWSYAIPTVMVILRETRRVHSSMPGR